MSKIVNKAIDVTKRYFFMLALMGMVVGFSAFKISESSNTQDEFWYYKQPGTNNYVQSTGEHEACETDLDNVICAMSFDSEVADPSEIDDSWEPLAEEVRYRQTP